jgi:RNA recognition motif-containing protein
VGLTKRIIMNTKLYVGNLALTTSESDLHEMFAPHGPVNEVQLPTDRDSGRPRGFAFVTMATPEAAQAAILALNGTAVAQRTLTVNEARPREERPSSFGAGRSDRGSGGRRY